MEKFYKISLSILCIILCISCNESSTPSNNENIQSFIDTVFSFSPGIGQNAGQDSTYFPKNIFGKPALNASENVQASSPEDICSLGFGGEIIVGFNGYEIYDGEGKDFTIFENAFLNPINNKIFAEPAKISVSSDGITYIEFPFDSLTLIGCAGISPVFGNKNAFDPKESGGDKFDLKDLGISSIRFIKITDISLMVKNNKQHPYYDAIITGFDLDAVAGLHLRKIK